MEVIAGDCGFFPDLVAPFVSGQVTFAALDHLRQQLCPEASEQASQIGFVQAWPKPCILMHAARGLRKDQERQVAQSQFDFLPRPERVLRAVEVSSNAPAREIGFIVPVNMRAPEESVISRVLVHESNCLEGNENLAWWTTSKGVRLSDWPVLVSARRVHDHVRALITPLEEP